MAGVTLAQAEAKLALWLAADDAVATGQAYSIAGRSLTRTDGKLIRENIEYWEARVKRLTRGGGIGVRGLTPRN